VSKHPGESESFLGGGSGGAISFEQAWPRLALPTSRLEERVTELFDLLQAPLCGYLMKLLGSLAEAEDVAQEAFLRLYSHLQGGKPVPNVRAWLFRVAHNLAVDRQRNEHRAEPLTADGWRQLGEHLADPAPQPEQTTLEREKMARMQAALVRLSPQERHCLYLRMEGLRYREIAEVLGIQTPTVVTFLTRGIKKLTKDLQ
jgi:RNA polymerase sigma-70 factor, ECF subfamily